NRSSPSQASATGPDSRGNICNSSRSPAGSRANATDNSVSANRDSILARCGEAASWNGTTASSSSAVMPSLVDEIAGLEIAEVAKDLPDQRDFGHACIGH